MQRLTWTGIALHESSDVPGFPASHGCVRIPSGFARELYDMTRSGAHVLITGEAVAPVRIAHANLPQPGDTAVLDEARDHWRIRMEQDGAMDAAVARMISTAAMLETRPANRKNSREPLRILITRLSQPEITARLQLALNRLGLDAGEIDGIAGAQTRSAIRRFQALHGDPQTGSVTPEVVDAVHRAAGMSGAPANGRLYVRRGFEPLFDAAITIAEPQRPLGTHLITATDFDPEKQTIQWSGMTLDNQLTDFSRAYFAIPDASAPQLPQIGDTLDRIILPGFLRERIANLLTPGSSIAISDTGLGPQTSWKTDFIIVTRLASGES